MSGRNWLVCALWLGTLVGLGASGGCTRGGRGTAVFGALCSADGDCQSGVCLAAGRCSMTCRESSECPGGGAWSCNTTEATGSRRVCLCNPSSIEVCDGVDNDCDGQIDNGALCDGNEVCQNGRCSCPAANLCDDVCVDLRTDPAHCGRCATACGPGQQCQNAQCSCPAENLCNGACVDLQGDPEHCGACDNPCAPGLSCISGQCTCPSGQQQCGRSCIDSLQDVDNCGACDRRCSDTGICNNGYCASTLYALFQSGPLGIVVDDSDVLWTNYLGGTVVDTALDYSQFRVLSDLPGSLPTGIAIDATNVYFTTYFNGAIMVAPRDGSAPATTLVDGLVSPRTLIADGDMLYVVETLGGRVRRVAKDGSSSLIIAQGQEGPLGLAVDASYVYWSNAMGGQIMRAPKDGSGVAVQLVAFLGSRPTAVAIDATSIYWTDAAEGTIMKSTLDGDDVGALLSGQEEPSGIAVDDQAVYWTNTTGGQVMRAGRNGEDPLALAVDQVGPTGIALSPTHVYWTNFGDGNVARVIK